MPRSYSISFKIKVVEEYFNCLNNNKVAKKYDIAPKRLREWRSKYKEFKAAVTASGSQCDCEDVTIQQTETSSTSCCVAIVSAMCVKLYVQFLLQNIKIVPIHVRYMYV
jgi:transposase-like protein